METVAIEAVRSGESVFISGTDRSAGVSVFIRRNIMLEKEMKVNTAMLFRKQNPRTAMLKACKMHCSRSILFDGMLVNIDSKVRSMASRKGAFFNELAERVASLDIVKVVNDNYLIDGEPLLR